MLKAQCRLNLAKPENKNEINQFHQIYSSVSSGFAINTSVKQKGDELSERASERRWRRHSERSSLNTANQQPNAKLRAEPSSIQNIVPHKHTAQACSHTNFATKMHQHKQAQMPQPSYISCTASPTTHLFELVHVLVAGVSKKQLVGLLCKCKWSTAAVHNGSL